MKKEEMLEFARKNWVPVLRDKSADFLCKLVKSIRPKKILEIGTCIGYSGIMMLDSSENSFLITIEKDPKRVDEAVENFEQANLSKRVNVINDDAKNVIEKFAARGEKFDFIFLDGPKGQYINYLPILKQLLNSKGCLVADDIYYHGLVKQGDYPKHKHRTIVFRLREFIEKITSDDDFDTTILDIDDGMSVSVLK